MQFEEAGSEESGRNRGSKLRDHGRIKSVTEIRRVFGVARRMIHFRKIAKPCVHFPARKRPTKRAFFFPYRTRSSTLLGAVAREARHLRASRMRSF